MSPANSTRSTELVQISHSTLRTLRTFIYDYTLSPWSNSGRTMRLSRGLV